MTDKELMQLALYALGLAKSSHNMVLSSDPPQSAWRYYDVDRKLQETITALDKRLEQPEQEPVAWVYPEGLQALKAGKPWTAYGTRQEPNNTALYLSPQPNIAPYAWVTFTPYGDEDDVWYENPEGQLLEGWTYKPLYDTTPPQRPWVGLTGEELAELSASGLALWDLWRAIEAKLRSKNT